MTLVKARSRGINLADNFAFTGTITGAGGGKVLQVVTVSTESQVATTSTSYTAVSGMTLDITPSATSSKILLMCNFNTHHSTDGNYFMARWERQISGGSNTTFGNGTYGQTYARAAQDNDFWGGVGMTYLDSPSTTSAITYQFQWCTSSGAAYLGNNSTNQNRIYAMEIAG